MKNDIEYLKKYYKGNIEEGITKLNKGYPVQYIVGNVNFYGYEFNVDENVLIPRFETEELVFKTINYINKYFNKPLKIVDLGTGSGCIAITLKKELNASVSAVDISDDALNVAKKNALKNNVLINFHLGNMLEPLKDKYDIIISNPPYIAYDEDISNLVKNNEPPLALFAEDAGLYYYKEILKKSVNYLNEKNIIIFEIGFTQAEIIKEYAKTCYPNATVKIEKDLQGRNRFIFIFSNID